MSRLKGYKLENYGSNDPIIFVYADDPDHACSKVYTGLTKVLLTQKPKNKNILQSGKFVKDILNDVRITRCVVAQNEKKL